MRPQISQGFVQFPGAAFLHRCADRHGSIVVSLAYRLTPKSLVSTRAPRCTGIVGLALAVSLIFGGCRAHRPPASGRSETAERLVEQGRHARERGELQAAETLLAAAVDRSPGDGEIRLELAELLLEDRNGAAAETHLRALVTRTPDDPRPCVSLAEARLLQHDFGEAENLL